MNKESALGPTFGIKIRWVVVIALSAAVISSAENPPDSILSPSGRFKVEIGPASGENGPGHELDELLIVSKRDRVLAHATTIGYLLGAYWTRNEQYVAVNNRRGNSGDYLWVVSLRTGKIVKRPDDIRSGEKEYDSDASTRAIVAKVTAQLPEFTWKTFLRRTTIANSWLMDNQLRVNTSLLFSNGNGVWVLLTEIYHVGEEGLQLRDAKVTAHHPSS